MRTGGRGRCTGLGRITASRRLNSSAWRVTRSSVHSRVRISKLRSNRRPRCLKGTPTASNSRAYQPAATPRISRPLLMTSSVPIALAATVGLRSGRTSTPVPSLMVVVRAAMAVSVPIASRIGKEGSTPRITWSQAQRDSKPSASARCAYRYSSSMSGVSVGPTKFLMARPNWVTRWCLLAEEATLGVERAQQGQLVVGGRLGLGRRRDDLQREPGAVAHLLDSGAGVRCLDPHAPCLRVEAEDPQRGDHAGDAAEDQAGPGTSAVAVEPGGTGDEIHAGYEAPLLVGREDDHLSAQRGDVVGPAGARQPHLRLPVVGADDARVDVAELVDLGAAHEPAVQEPAL